MSSVRLGGGQAGYGDAVEPVADVLEAGVDYLVCDALAETTLAVLQKDRQRDPDLGYTRDVSAYVRAVLPYLRAGRTRLITNAGGLKTRGALEAVASLLRSEGATGVRVCGVFGDDLGARATELGAPDDSLFVRAYLGAAPIVRALESGADVVVTGRVADANLFLAPLVHEYGWRWDDWYRMAAGVTIGHLLECSAQVSGAVFSGPWWEDRDPSRPGYPIGVAEEDGSAVITKPPGTGGQVSFDTVREQLLYEVHDPRRYLNPDCTVDLTSVQLEDLGGDCVRVAGATGGPPPATYKALCATQAGWAGDAVMVFSWPDAEAKGRAAARTIRQRAEARGVPVEQWHEEYFGAGAHHGDAARRDLDAARMQGWEPPEVVVRLAWRCATPEDAEAVTQGGLGLTPPMHSHLGRPRRRQPTELFRLTSLAVPRCLVDPGVTVETIDV